MEPAELTLLVMLVAWFLPMGILVSFLMWRYADPELDAFIRQKEAQLREEASARAKTQSRFEYDLNNIDLSRVSPSMLIPKVRSVHLKH